MNPVQWQAVRDLFLEASEQDPESRARLLESAAARDPEIARRAARLLEADASDQTKVDNLSISLGLETDSGPTPDHIGRYKVLGVLGDGRAGIVYRVKQESPAREVALKLLRATMWSKGSLDRFRNEVKALSLLRHEHIARIYDAGTLPEPGGAARPYFVMELVEGKPITEFVASSELDERRTIELFLEVCDAVEHAHMQGVIHRDLKPANVLVDLPGCTEPTVKPVVKVIDFGIARILHSDERATLTGQVLGTPGYMSPEQMEGRSSAVDTRTDVFAAGAILRELLLPCSKSGAISQVKTVRLATDLRLILETATAHDLARRYQSMSAFSGDLRRYLANRPIEARAPTLRYSVSTFMRRNRALSGAIVIALVSVLSLLVLESLARQRAELARQRAERATAKMRVANSLLVNVFAEFYANRVGGAKERRSLVTKVLPSIEENAKDDPQDLNAQAQWAQALGAMGDVLQEEGQYEESLKYLRSALAIRERLYAENPSDQKTLSNLSIAIVRVGDLSAQVATDVPQRDWYVRALELDERAVRQWPDVPNVLSNLEFSYERLAAYSLNRDNFEEATSFSERQIAAARRLLELEPQSELALWGMSSALGTKVSILEKRRMMSERAKVGEEEIRLLRQLQRVCPEVRQYQKRLVGSLVGTAGAKAVVEGRFFTSMISMIEEAVVISRRLMVADPTEMDARLLHARTLCALSSALTESRSSSLAASDALAEAGRTADDLATRCSNCEEALLAQVRVRLSVVRSASALGNLDEVRTKGRAMLPLTRKLCSNFPHVENQKQLCRLLLDLPDASPEECKEAVALARLIAGEKPRHQIENSLTLIESLVYAGQLNEAEEEMAELRRSLPVSETMLRDAVEIERMKWDVKPSISAGGRQN